jgi:hypothetical protein
MNLPLNRLYRVPAPTGTQYWCTRKYTWVASCLINGRFKLAWNHFMGAWRS